MLMAMPTGGSLSETVAEARADMYDDALSDIPPWAIHAAIKRWGKGEVPELGMGSLNFQFAPAPAILRKICKIELQPYEDQALKLTVVWCGLGCNVYECRGHLQPDLLCTGSKKFTRTTYPETGPDAWPDERHTVLRG
jgi:hypothetical protein